MKTIYIDKQHINLDTDGKRIKLKADKTYQALPLQLIERIIIYGHCNLNAKLLYACQKHNVSIVFINKRSVEPVIIFGSPHKDAKGRISQYRWLEKKDIPLNLATHQITNKITKQLKLIKKITSTRTDKDKILQQTYDKLKFLLTNKSLTEPINTNQLLGIEGCASKFFFQAYTQLFAPSLNFTKRAKHPAPDPVNSVLSLTYTILYSQAVKAIY
ncbi:MAG: CRISPR-associated endonuclease Cas1 [Gammaproteobacteria bacterium]|nr:MAG: CRISPR-associated endonuclease Cas1 [Gammaproteobacteria bacterium]